ncbi:TPA: ead/Ea22-like family protein [Citrobacter freundii]
MTAFNKQALREQIESAADAYWQFDNGWISDMKCGDLSHEYLLFVKEPKNVLALLDENLQLQRDKDSLEAVAIAMRDDMREAREKLEAAEKRIAELEAREGKPVMFIDGDISPADADKLAAVIREFNEETETPAARMARIIRENPHPTNMCDMPAAGIGVKGE